MTKKEILKRISEISNEEEHGLIADFANNCDHWDEAPDYINVMINDNFSYWLGYLMWKLQN